MEGGSKKPLKGDVRANSTEDSSSPSGGGVEVAVLGEELNNIPSVSRLESVNSDDDSTDGEDNAPGE